MLQQHIDAFLIECDTTKQIRKRWITTEARLDVVINFITVVTLDVQGSNPLILNSLQIVQCRFAKSGACDAQVWLREIQIHPL